MLSVSCSSQNGIQSVDLQDTYREENLILKRIRRNSFWQLYSRWWPQGTKEPADLPLWVLNLTLSLGQPAADPGRVGGKSGVFLTHNQQACKGKNRGNPVYVHWPEWVMAEFMKQGDVALNLHLLLTIGLFFAQVIINRLFSHHERLQNPRSVWLQTWHFPHKTPKGLTSGQ